MRLIDVPFLRNFTSAQLSSFRGVPTNQAGGIKGCQLFWVSTSAVDVGPGDLHIEGLGQVVQITALTHATGLTGLTASAWANAYAYVPTPTATPTLVVANVAPASPYAGTARSASATIAGNPANLHRWLGPILTDGAGTPAIRQFNHQWQSGIYKWLAMPLAGSYWGRVLGGGVAIVPTDVSLAACVPPQSTMALITFTNLSTVAAALVAQKGAGMTSAYAGSQQFEQFCPPATSSTAYFQGAFWMGLDSSQTMQYLMQLGTTPAAGLIIDGNGFQYAR